MKTNVNVDDEKDSNLIIIAQNLIRNKFITTLKKTGFLYFVFLVCLHQTPAGKRYRHTPSW